MTRLAPFMNRLLREDESGVVVVEFALWSTMFFLVVSVAMDFGSLFLERGKMNEAVSATAISAFKTADNVSFGSLPGYVRALSAEPAMSVSIICNGTAGSCTNFSRPCACLKADATYVTAACGNTCTGSGTTAGSTAGYYLTIEATQTFDPLIVPKGMLDGASIVQRATVRLQ